MPETAAAKIAIIDDDALFRESLTGNLENEGYTVDGFAGGRIAIDALHGGHAPDLILLDWKMPEMNGIEVLKTLREDGNRTPVIFLTVLSDQIYEETALLGGAIDFVEKSRSFAILRKRIELALHSAGNGNAVAATAASAFDIGKLSINAVGKTILWNGEEVSLTIGEFDIVHVLAARAGDNVSYREIYDTVRGSGFIAGQGDDGFRQNVRTFIKRIRRKFLKIDPGFDAIENYPGYGYRWQAKNAG